MIRLVVLVLWQSYSVKSLQCLSQSNKPVDWFIAYKLPGSANSAVTSLKKNAFYYMDVNAPSWTLSQSTLDDTDQSVFYTLNQIYSSGNSNSSDMLYLMYNDELPVEKSRSKRWEVEHGHTKGVIAFDSRTGFWLIHSTPKFPYQLSHGYQWPDSAEIYGQSFLCISMAIQDNLDEIGKQLMFNYPQIYDKAMSSFLGSYPNMANAMAGKHVTDSPWWRETTLTSLAGTKFTSFAKYANFDNDLYAELLAPRFMSTLFVETWQNGRGKMCSNCTGKYKVFNIETVKFSDACVDFKETQDHSKWVVTNTTASVWTCIGDINRQESQMRRPGGTVCFQNKSVWKNFHEIIATYHDCQPYRECIPPTEVNGSLHYKPATKAMDVSPDVVG